MYLRSQVSTVLQCLIQLCTPRSIKIRKVSKRHMNPFSYSKNCAVCVYEPYRPQIKGNICPCCRHPSRYRWRDRAGFYRNLHGSHLEVPCLRNPLKVWNWFPMNAIAICPWFCWCKWPVNGRARWTWRTRLQHAAIQTTAPPLFACSKIRQENNRRFAALSTTKKVACHNPF